MNGSLFITGSSGFIAGNFLRRIKPEEYKNIYCLSRNESKVTTSLSEYNNFKFIKGSIFNTDLYMSYLKTSDIVVHFAAATGKARPEEYFEVNAEGTEFLIKQCEQLGVKRFLYISSISVKFTDISQYYYAQSKQKGEDAVKSSSLNYSIVRPTIVIGKESAILKSLFKIAKRNIIPIFGDGTTRVQPIYIDDLAECLLTIISENSFSNETFDLGGPEVITIENFIKGIHRVCYKNEPKTIHIPLSLLIPVLSFLEKFVYSYMPINIGQLSSFRFDGTAEKNKIFLKHHSRMKNVDEMLRSALTMDKKLVPTNMLNNECHVFCDYLISQKPSEYILEKYQDAHSKGKVKQNDLNFFDNLLISIARKSPSFAKLVDVYTSIFYKRAVFRKKMILLLAILESCEPACYYLDLVTPSGKTMLYVRIFQRVSLFMISLFFAVIIFTPLHVIYKIFSRSHGP